MYSFIQLRHKTYFARLAVPADLQPRLGKREIIRTLKTSDARTAQLRAMKLVAEIKMEFEAARGRAGAIESQAIAYRRDTDGRTVADEVSGNTHRDAAAEHFAEQLPDEKQQAFYDVLHGRATRFDILLDEFLAGWKVADKTKHMARTAIGEMAEVFQTLEAVTKKRLRQWLHEDDRTAATHGKNLGFVRRYWAYLQEQEVVPEMSNPFRDLGLRTGAQKASAGSRKPFAPHDILTLLAGATKRSDGLLEAMIRLGAYTGARIEEIASLKVSDVQTVGNVLCFRISDAKTAAGNRLVPAHSQLRGLVERLSAASTDGYLLAGLTENKYGDRSNALGKRFGRLKTELGFDSTHVFHSLRKTVATMLENAGISEGLAADILGHEKQTMTYGLYSGGHSPVKMLEALETIVY